MLLQVIDSGLKNMAVSNYPEMTQFLTNMDLTKETTTVTFAPQNAKPKSITIPLKPDTSKLESLDINMHNSPTTGYRMPASYSEWFSQCFGYPVVFAYLGPNKRDVLFEDLKPPKSMLSVLKGDGEHKITFADCAPYLFVSSTSLSAVSSLLPSSSPMDITKFRPNIVLSGAATPWEEDYWGRLHVNGVDVELKHNCVRCKSINIDYATGKPGTGETGKVLAKLQKDRRVDKGAKWSPVFGRYGYWGAGKAGKEVVWRVGDEVKVTRINRERTVWSKFRLCCVLGVDGKLTYCRLAESRVRVHREVLRSRTS